MHGPDPDDYDLYLAHYGLRRPALSYFQRDTRLARLSGRGGVAP